MPCYRYWNYSSEKNFGASSLVYLFILGVNVIACMNYMYIA